MELEGISPASISASKQVAAQEQAQVKVLKSSLDSDAQASQQLIQSISEAPAPSGRAGVGAKLNVVA